MAEYTQSERVAELKSAFGKKLVLSRFTGSEGMSQLFEFRVEGVSEKEAQLNFDDQLGRDCTVTLRTKGRGDRHFTGTCTEAVRLGRGTEGFEYVLILRPALWLLSKRTNMRVFEEKTIPDIIRAVFADHSYVKPKFKLSESNYPKLEYCVQHRESDLDFVLRLMEAEGISYHFEFGDNSQTVVLCDSNSYEAVPGGSRVYNDDEDHAVVAEEHLYRLSPERRFTTGKATLNDYKFQEPKSKFVADKSVAAEYANSELEHYSFPYHQSLAKETMKGFGEYYAEVRVLAERGEDGRFLATGDCGSFVAGYTMKLEKHPTDSHNFLILGCAHTIEDQDYRSGGGGSRQVYRGEYEFMRVARFVPPLITLKPWIGGPQTGVVVNPEGSKAPNAIHTDEFGRIQVHLHWNRADENKPEGRTMWCRVAQTWAGRDRKFGAFFLPRVGMEVLVDHIDGDPDRPIVTGCVYNKDNMPPYPQPGEQYHTGWKTDFESGPPGHHELVFIDTKEKEKVRAHSGKDLEWTIVNDESRDVGNDRTTYIKVNDTLDVGDTLDITAGQKISLTVGQSNITMTPGKITIDSPEIVITATAKLTTESKLVADHKAGATMTITGAMVLIN
jgi:type VI secretion system secreted protein VgrG